MKTPEKGMILLTTIIMINILAMLILMLMHAVFLYIKASNQMIFNHEAFYQLEAVAHQIAAEPYEAECLLTNEEPNQISALLLKNNGCLRVEQERQYYYLIDDLGNFPCLKILENNQAYASRHWIITVLTESPRMLILQFRIAQQGRAMVCQNSSERLIRAGVVSWRFIS